LSCKKRRNVREKRTGRKGMDPWHLLLVAVVHDVEAPIGIYLRPGLKHHELGLRAVIAHTTAFIEDEKIESNYQTISDNVSLIDRYLLKKST